MLDPPNVCSECGYDFPSSCDRCPHCARPGIFPNVRAAEQPWEQEALERRYTTAVSEAARRGAESTLRAFELKLAGSKAVIARNIDELMRLATSDREIYATYYDLVAAGVRIPAGDRWDVLRVATEQSLFPGYKERIRFAALTLDGEGLANYGICSLVLRDSMIAHRASVFEGNPVMWMIRRKELFEGLGSVEPGFRTAWANRARLAIAKLGGRLEPDTPRDSFPRLLLSQGATLPDDDFVEVHVYESLTVRTLERVKIGPLESQLRMALCEYLRERLGRLGVEVS